MDDGVQQVEQVLEVLVQVVLVITEATLVQHVLVVVITQEGFVTPGLLQVAMVLPLQLAVVEVVPQCLRALVMVLVLTLQLLQLAVVEVVPHRALIIGNMRCTWKKNEMNMKNKCYKASGEGFGRR